MRVEVQVVVVVALPVLQAVAAQVVMVAETAAVVEVVAATMAVVVADLLLGAAAVEVALEPTTHPMLHL
jgi:hypothetical protein